MASCQVRGFRLPPAVLAMLREFSRGLRRGRPRLQRRTSLVALATAGFKAVGVDVSAQALALAAETTPQAKLHCANISDFTFASAHTVTALGDVMCYQIKDGRHALKNNIVLDRLSRAGTGRNFSTSWTTTPQTGINTEIAVPDTIDVSTTACTKTATGHGFIGILPSITRSAADCGGPVRPIDCTCIPLTRSPTGCSNADSRSTWRTRLGPSSPSRDAWPLSAGKRRVKTLPSSNSD